MKSPASTYIFHAFVQSKKASGPFVEISSYAETMVKSGTSGLGAADPTGSRVAASSR